jgi:hypothetical protein
MSQIHLTLSIPVTLRTDFVENSEGPLSDRQHIITRSRNSCENHERTMAPKSLREAQP